MKYPPTREPGCPVSACQRSGSVKVDIGTGTVSTLAAGGSRSAANAAVQPGGTGLAVLAVSGAGTMGSTASTVPASTTAAGRQPDASRGRPRGRPSRGRDLAAMAATAGIAASTAKASSAAAVPSATRENRSGRAALSSGRPCSQYQGSLIAWYSCPPNSKVPPSENTPRTAQATAAARTGSRRQPSTAASTSTTISGQPR